MISLEGLELSRFFLATILLLFSAHLFGYVFNRLKMPKAIGEIFGGLMLGPTILGYFAPELYNTIFMTEGKLLAVLYWLGLVLLMFSSGFEVQSKYDRKDKKTVIWITLLSTIIPFIAGWLLAGSFFDVNSLIGEKNNVTALKLIIAVSIAVTSIPVISKIFFDLGIIKTRFAKIVLGAATVHDIVLWIFIAIATGLVSATIPTATSMFWHIIITIVFFAFALFAMPKIIALMRKKQIRPVPKDYEAGFVIILLLFFVVLASFLGINIIFGAFLAGIIIGLLKSEVFTSVKKQVKEFSFSFFVPIYFAIVGIKLDLIHHLDIHFFLLFLILATLIQGFSVLIASRLSKHSWASSFNLAVAMNARGGPGIVIATVALETGIINETFFATLILVAIVTSIMAGSWLKYIISKNKPLLDENE